MSTARSAPNADLLPGSGSPPASGRGEAPGEAVHGSPSRPQGAGAAGAAGSASAAGDVAAHDEPTLYAAEHAAAAFGIERLAPVPAAPVASGDPTPAPSAASGGVVAESDAGSMGSLSEAWRIIDTDLDKISEVLPLEQRPTLYLEVGSVVTAPHRVPGTSGSGTPAAADFPASPADLPTGPRDPLAEPPTEPLLTPLPLSLPLLDPLESRPEARPDPRPDPRPDTRPDPLGAKTTVPFLAPVQAVPSGTPIWPAWQPGYAPPAPPASHVPTGELPIVSAEQRRSQLWANLSMGLLGGGLMLFLVVLGLRLPALRAAASGSGEPAAVPVSASASASAAPVQPVQPAPIDPARQYLIEQAVQALSAGRAAEALDLLGRFQAGGADPAVEIMIKKLSVHGRRPLR